MIESLACGTPVVAYRGGSVDEVIEDGVTGFIVEDLDQAIDATKRTHTLDRRACRDAFTRRFSGARMASSYVRLYRQVASSTAGAGIVA
jgi:glycosyltransferase involved in cell wall biosynthesis